MNEVVCTHSYVIGELSLGDMKQRSAVPEAVQNLPTVTVATDREVFSFIDAHALYSTGIAHVDVHLLAAVLLTPGSTLWTLDKRLHDAAARMGVAADALH